MWLTQTILDRYWQLQHSKNEKCDWEAWSERDRERASREWGWVGEEKERTVYGVVVHRLLLCTLFLSSVPPPGWSSSPAAWPGGRDNKMAVMTQCSRLCTHHQQVMYYLKKLTQLLFASVESSQMCSHIDGWECGRECETVVWGTCSQVTLQTADRDSSWGTWQTRQETPKHITTDKLNS